MYGTLPRSFTGSEIASQRSRRRRILDVRHLNQYATFRLNSVEAGLVMSPTHRQQFEDFGSHQDLMLDEETLRATRFNSTRLSMSVEESNSEDYESSSSEEKVRSIPMVQQRPPPPPPRRRPDSVEVSVLSPTPSSTGEERVRSLPSSNVYKPLPPLPTADDDNCDTSADVSSSSDDSSGTPRSLRTSGPGSPSCSTSSKKLSVTFCENDVISTESGSSRNSSSNLLKALFLKKSTPVNKSVASATTTTTPPVSKLKTPTVTPTPILVPRPLTTNGERRHHLPLAKRLSNKLKEPFTQSKEC